MKFLKNDPVLRGVFGFKGLLYFGFFLVLLVGALASGTPSKKDDSAAIAQAFGVGSVICFGTAFVLTVLSDEPEN